MGAIETSRSPDENRDGKEVSGGTTKPQSTPEETNELVQAALNRHERDVRDHLATVAEAASRGVIFGIGRGIGKEVWERFIKPLIEQ